MPGCPAPQVARKIDGFAGRSKFSTWLYIVTANCARQTYRSLKRRADEQSRAAAPARCHRPAHHARVIAGSRLDLLDALERLEAHRPELSPRW